DGDTPQEERRWTRAYSRWVLTNPDMVHRGVLPNHQRWSRLLRNLRFVVIDESHSYRGVLGSAVALVIRRLLRIARHYGAEPVVALASATTADPARFATRLIGAEVDCVIGETSPHPGADFVLWEPPFDPTVPD